MWQPLKQLVNDAITETGDPNPYLIVKIEHPHYLPETRTPDANSPLELCRYWRYTPIETPPISQPQYAERLIVALSNERALVIRAVSSEAQNEPGVRTGADWLASEYARTKEISAADDMLLILSNTLDDYLKVLLEAEKSEDANDRFIWSGA